VKCILDLLLDTETVENDNGKYLIIIIVAICLLSIYQDHSVFVSEFETMLMTRLMSCKDYDIDEEVFIIYLELD
jgi:hypothetical protein